MTLEFKPCSVTGCDGNASREAEGRTGMCRRHYLRFAKYGDYNIPPVNMRGEAARFYRDVVLPCEGDGCLIWPFGRDRYGYAVLKVGGTMSTVSRLVCEAVNGAPPSNDHQAAHNCNSGHLGCVNPKHMRWATRLENAADAVAAGVVGPKLSAQEVLRIAELRPATSIKRLAEQFKCSQGTIVKALRREGAYSRT